MAADPTPEEIEEKRAAVAAYDAAQAEAAKSVNRAKLQPLADLGFGGAGPLTCSASDLATALRAGATALAEFDPGLPNLFFTTAQVLETANDKVRSLVAQNAPTPEA